MSFKEKNITTTLVIFSLILVYFLGRVIYLLQTDTFTQENIFPLWGTVIGIAVIGIILAMILTHAASAILEVIQTGNPDPEIDDLEDERDQLIDLKGTSLTYSLHSFGTLAAMLTFVFGQEALVMFTAMILSGLVAQILGDVRRLMLYRRSV